MFKGISSVITKKNNQTLLKKEYDFFYAADYVYRSWLLHSYYKYQFNSQSIGRPDKRKAARDTRFVG